MNLDQFSIRISNIGTQIEANSHELVKAVALVVDQAVVVATPVDTGRARSNWIVEVNRAATGVVEAGNVASVLSSARTTINSAQPGATIHVTNNLPYIQRLNDGYSAQAPANFVETSIQQGINAVRRSQRLFR